MHFSVPVTSILSVLTLILSGEAAPAKLEARQSGTRNDLQSGACKPYTLIFARGTTEGGNMGSVVGPQLASALASVLGGTSQLAVQGVNYPADVAGYNSGGSASGSQEMASWVQKACSTTKIILSGYSQGAQLVHNAAGIISTTDANKVRAVVMFGDPKNGQALGKGLDSRKKTYCNAGDLICLGQPVILYSHLTYGSDASAAAQWVRSII